MGGGGRGLIIKWRGDSNFRAECNSKMFSSPYFHQQQLNITLKEATETFD